MFMESPTLVTGPLYYVNYTYRGTITDYIPGNVSLPVQFYCYSNTGPFRVDWVRVRDFDATLPTHDRAEVHNPA